MPAINELLREHVTLDVQCLDWIYLNSFIPILQFVGQLVTFLTKHRKQAIPSPSLLEKITVAFEHSVEAFAQLYQIPTVHFEPGTRKDDLAGEFRKRFDLAEGVIFIGVGEEKARAF